MKIAIYSPYLDTSGGGEKYILTIAEALSVDNKVDILLDAHLAQIGVENVVNKISKLHNLDLTRVKFINSPLGIGGNFFSRLFFLRKYDWLFFLTDGSVFYSTAKNSVIHFQVPFESSPQSLWGKIKLSSWERAIYNSNFTKDIIKKYWDLKGEVIYPPVSVEELKLLKKKKQILSVGRFFGFLKDKKHEILIKSYKSLIDGGKIKGWSLHLAGGAGEGDKEYIESLKKMAQGYEVYFYPNLSFEDLKILFGESQIYWHATGFGEDDPKKFEHFGITVVEAMAAGCIPVVINKGGLKEIVDQGINGYLWDTIDQLKEFTLSITEQKSLEKFTKNSIQKSKDFSKEKFVEKIRKLVNG